MNVKALKQALADPSTEVEVLAVDPVIYLLRVVTIEDGVRREAILKNPKGENWVFRSLSAARVRLAEWRVRQAFLIQQSAYGEMVGTEGGLQESELRLPLTIPQDD
ncbi:MAG: DUF6482 family protein [Pseudomonadota bacterium]